MIIINELLLDSFRDARKCEICGTRIMTSRADPMHIIARGMGGGSRVDIPENLIAGCRECHSAQHNGRITIKTLWEIVAKRLRKTPEECCQAVWLVLRTPKPPSTKPAPPLTKKRHRRKK